MDEILIDDKKYVSSKRAAKMTGYAKDYVGQLCREGRVPARLVGRSWYVLETAIQDHRFGSRDSEVKQASKTAPVKWESPRYEAAQEEIIGPVNDPQEEEVPTNQNSSPETSPESLNDTWKAWFSRVGATEPLTVDTPEEPGVELNQEDPIVEPEIAEEIEEIREEEEEVNIPIHTIYERPPEDLLPRSMAPKASDMAIEPDFEQTMPRRRHFLIKIIQTLGTIVAIASVALAVIGTGYLDSYLPSNDQISRFSGIIKYSK